jgi:hypothetical protein
VGPLGFPETAVTTYVSIYVCRIISQKNEGLRYIKTDVNLSILLPDKSNKYSRIKHKPYIQSPNPPTCFDLLRVILKESYITPTPVQTGPGAYPSSYIMGTAYLPGVKRPGSGVDH